MTEFARRNTHKEASCKSPVPKLTSFLKADVISFYQSFLKSFLKADVISMIEQLLPRLESADFIWRYSWWVTR